MGPQTYQIILSCFRTLFFAFLTLCDVTDDATGVLLGHQRFLVNNFRSNEDRIEKVENRRKPMHVENRYFWRGLNSP